MFYKVKPIIIETILNLNDAIQCDADENMLTSYLASFKVGDGSTITTEWFNAADAHKLRKDRRIIQVELLWMTFVQKEFYEVTSVRRKKCVKIYSDFDEPVFQNMKWFDSQTWDQNEKKQLK